MYWPRRASGAVRDCLWCRQGVKGWARQASVGRLNVRRLHMQGARRWDCSIRTAGGVPKGVAAP